MEKKIIKKFNKLNCHLMRLLWFQLPELPPEVETVETVRIFLFVYE